ncbi:PAP2 superfamily protein [Tritrichomonas foetus]|uniref:PAP2 superfamily protein n=1 Tax=Tritrichomonas foetus TaxID=1144522 RepID=A0A1J4JMR9_9EUKA|nr:PAP2 superfamily protein [Tritrichomonas foetus]|eukprot:OHT00417.1 PAP2 superfamily protein [Tritrichomonas foetus]
MPHKSEYYNAIGDQWHSRCWLLHSPTWLVDLGKTFGRFIDILYLGDFLQFVIFVVNFCNFTHQSEIESVLYHAHNLFLVPLGTILGLYLIFKQPRPGKSRKTGKQIGALYGMPSGDSFASASFGASFMKICFPLGLFLAISIPFSRIVRGYHTIPQAAVGSTLGIFYTIGINSLGNSFYFVNWVLAAVLPFLVVFDPQCAVQTKGDIYNFHSWLFSNSVFCFYDYFVCSPESIRPFPEIDKHSRVLIGYLVVVVGKILEYYVQYKALSFYISNPFVCFRSK